ALVMKAPVWYILDRVSLGGDSWHRAYLIDVAMRNIGRWWLAGMEVADTANWFPYTINGGADITNQYLVFGINAGIVAIGLFIIVLSRAFGLVGRGLARLRVTSGLGATGFMLWGMGVMLGVHVITWFGISYFDQMYAVWFLQLAALVSISESIASRRKPIATLPRSEGLERAPRRA